MLSIKWGLLKYLIWKTLPVTLIATAVACVYVLAWPELFTSQDVGPVAFILSHCLVIMIALGHNANGQYEFLQTRGFTRGQILGRMTLVAAGALVVAWAVAAVLVWTPIRGLVQYPNPLFPIMAPNEHPAVWAWLGYYAIGFALTWVGSWLLALPTYNRGGVLLFVSCVLAVLFLIIAYSITLPDRYSRRRTAARWMRLPARDMTFYLSNPNIEGTELWINGVNLGTMPVTISPSEFEAKVPYWAQPPAANATGAVTTKKYLLTSVTKGTHYPWDLLTLDISENGSAKSNIGVWNRHSPRPKPDKAINACYFRLRHGNDWSYTKAFSRMPVHYDRNYRLSNIVLHAAFPNRAGRLERLIDQARLADYQINANWLAAMNTYNDDAAIALLAAAKREPRMLDIYDAVAADRYDLHQIVDADSAWSAFQRICADVDRQGRYFVPGISARAIELVASKLSDDRLCNKAERLIDNARWNVRTGSQIWQDFDDSGVGYWPHAGHHEGLLYWGFDNIPASGFAVAHAVWVLHQAQRDQRSKGETLIQKRLGPALVRRGQYELGARIGGRLVEDFLLRQAWRKQKLDPRYNRKSFRHGGQANLWLYLLAGLDSPAGEQFRKENRGPITSMAYDVVSRSHAAKGCLSDLKCLFMDPALAEKFWPTFRSQVTHLQKRTPLAWQWEYLNTMRPAPSVQEYVDCWKQSNDPEIAFGYTLQALHSLEADKREAIIEGLIEYIKQMPNGWIILEDERFHAAIVGQTEGTREELVAKLAGRDRFVNAQRVAKWLEHTEPTSPLVGMLAEQKDPALRAMAIAPCRAHPTAEHRTILTKLAADPDEAVRTKAQTALAELAELAKTDPMTLADPPR